MKLSSSKLLLSGWAGTESGPTKASEAGQVGVIPWARGGGEGVADGSPGKPRKPGLKSNFQHAENGTADLGHHD